MLSLIVPLVSLAAVPGVAELVRLLVVVILCVIIIAIIRSPQVGIPAPWGQYAVWIVAAALVIFLVWEALVLTGIV